MNEDSEMKKLRDTKKRRERGIIKKYDGELKSETEGRGM